MIKSAVTISLVPEARGGPFVFWDDLPGSVRKAQKLGFDAVEIFPRSASELDPRQLKQLLGQHQLKLAAMGTGAGWLVHKLRLTDPEATNRQRAREFVAGIIDVAGSFGAPAVVGSMQGRWEGNVSRDQALGWLAAALEELAPQAHRHGVPLLFEPLNRYETNLICTVADGVAFLKTLSTSNVKLLADLFHMNIEETNIADGIRAGKGYIGHVHFVDSNRRAAGLGHINYKPIAAALKEIGYEGYASAEAFAYPDSDAAAKQTIAAYNKYIKAKS